MKMRAILYPEFRDFLQRLGYKEKQTPKAIVYQHPDEGLLVFRLYREDEIVALRDLMTTRKFLDLRGMLDAASFDAFLMQASTPA